MEKEVIDRDNDLEFVFNKNELDDSSDEEDEGPIDPEMPVEENDEQLGKRQVPGVRRKKRKMKKGKIQIEFEEPEGEGDMLETLQQVNF